MCQPSAVSGPALRTPAEWATPKPRSPAAHSAPASDQPTCGHRRRRPRRMTPTFDHTSAITAIPAAPCPHTTSPA